MRMNSIIPVAIASGLILATGCSSLVESTRKSLLGSDSPRQADQEVKWVSKAQYDQLMGKYKALNDKYEKLKDDSLSASGSPVKDIGETVDVFATNGLADQASEVKSQSPKASPHKTASSPEELTGREVDQEIQYYKKAVALNLNGKVPEALKIFQYLERSSTDQIRVRARAHIGNIYMQQGQYDLALQVYEKIIQSDAFSGKVFEALKGAVVCSEKLNLGQKKSKYQSILNDFFEIQI